MKRLILRLLLLGGCLLSLLRSAAQEEQPVYRLELGVGLGAGFPVTDVKDKPNLDAALLARFPLNPRMAIKTTFSYVGMKGSTDGMKAFLPADPSQSGTERLKYEVNDAIFDLNGMYELHFLPYGYERGYQGYCRLVPYIQIGLGVSYGKAGKAFTMNLPVGIGAKYKIGPRLNLGLDGIAHFTPSDKLDGLEAPLGIKSSMFRNKDHYVTLLLTLTYDLNPRCPTCNKY